MFMLFHLFVFWLFVGVFVNVLLLIVWFLHSCGDEDHGIYDLLCSLNIMIRIRSLWLIFFYTHIFLELQDINPIYSSASKDISEKSAASNGIAIAANLDSLESVPLLEISLLKQKLQQTESKMNNIIADMFEEEHQVRFWRGRQVFAIQMWITLNNNWNIWCGRML